MDKHILDTAIKRGLEKRDKHLMDMDYLSGQLQDVSMRIVDIFQKSMSPDDLPVFLFCLDRVKTQLESMSPDSARLAAQDLAGIFETVTIVVDRKAGGSNGL